MKTKINYLDGEIYDVSADIKDTTIENVVISHNGKVISDPSIKMRLQATIQLREDFSKLLTPTKRK